MYIQTYGDSTDKVLNPFKIPIPFNLSAVSLHT